MMIKIFGLPIIFVFEYMRSFQAIFWIRAVLNFCKSVQEGPRDFSNTAKCSQLPHLYMTCEATYSLKRIFWEILPKNRFFLYAKHNILINIGILG